jgi:hypothetical protein
MGQGACELSVASIFIPLLGIHIMGIKTNLFCVIASALALLSTHAKAVTVQTASDVFDGRPYLYVEAESFASRGADPENDGWKVVSKETPVNSALGVPILPATSNVSGTAILDDVGGGGHTDTVLYEMTFITAGTYQLFTRHSMYDQNGNGNVGNEDSVYLSPAFNKNSNGDWVGFEGLDFDEFDVNVDIPNPGYAADPDGWKPSTADSTNDGWYALRDWGVKSEGTVDLSATPSPLFNGNFNWYNRPFFVGALPAGGFATDYGFKTEYTVTPAMVGQTVTFEMGTREVYGVFDGFLFIQTSNIYPDQDILDLYSQAELDAVLPVPIDPDYNGDDTVDAADYVQWRKGESPDDTEAGYDLWKTHFGEPGGAGGSGGVPEPASVGLLVIGLAALTVARRRSGR